MIAGVGWPHENNDSINSRSRNIAETSQLIPNTNDPTTLESQADAVMRHVLCTLGSAPGQAGGPATSPQHPRLNRWPPTRHSYIGRRPQQAYKYKLPAQKNMLLIPIPEPGRMVTTSCSSRIPDTWYDTAVVTFRSFSYTRYLVCTWYRDIAWDQ